MQKKGEEEEGGAEGGAEDEDKEGEKRGQDTEQFGGGNSTKQYHPIVCGWKILKLQQNLHH